MIRKDQMTSFLKKVYQKLGGARFAPPLATRKELCPPLGRNFPNGDLILCNLCGTVFDRLGPDHPEFLACPYCDCIARERVVYQIILNELSQSSSSTLLVFSNSQPLREIRCLECSPRVNTNRRRLYDTTLKSYVASDYDMLAHRADIRMDLANSQDVAPYRGVFDIIICAHVLEHIVDYRTALQNLAFMLAPGGFIVLQVPLLERQYTRVTWEEFHGDRTRVFHRFGFDLMAELEPLFHQVTPVVGLLDFPITSSEIKPDKYESLNPYLQQTIVFGEQARRLLGLGSPDLCDAFIARRRA